MIDFTKIKTRSIKERKNKVILKNFVDPKDANLSPPNEQIKDLARAIAEARQKNKQVIFQFGGHVIKTGMSLFIIDLIRRGVITHIAGNGSVSIHDFEIAMIGATSEDVASAIEDGSFGMAEETGRLMNEAVNASSRGYGHAMGERIEAENFPFKDHSIIYAAYKKKIPATIHVAIGTDIIHQHPACDGGKLGAATFYDFKRYTETVSKLKEGVLVNIGSAVIMPEVFLKALTVARNLGHDVSDITTANLDMIDHYRTKVNIVERPTSLGTRGFNIIGRHEQLIPRLYREIVDRLE